MQKKIKITYRQRKGRSANENQTQKCDRGLLCIWTRIKENKLRKWNLARTRNRSSSRVQQAIETRMYMKQKHAAAILRNHQANLRTGQCVPLFIPTIYVNVSCDFSFMFLLKLFFASVATTTANKVSHVFRNAPVFSASGSQNIRTYYMLVVHHKHTQREGYLYRFDAYLTWVASVCPLDAQPLTIHNILLVNSPHCSFIFTARAHLSILILFFSPFQ